MAQQPSCNILDIGGTASYWNTYGHKIPKGVTISLVNLTREEIPEGDIVSSFIGDARSLNSFADKSFDIVYSNSVIEHVGLWRDMAAMAGEVRRLAPRYFVQTPNYWFPIEAHYRLPFFHLLPDPIKQSLLLRNRRGFVPKASDIGEASALTQCAFLLTKRQMRFLFPEATIEQEKFFGLTKSLMAIRE